MVNMLNGEEIFKESRRGKTLQDERVYLKTMGSSERRQLMRFHGLFIGIDKYFSPLINELSCAVRDARALYALFADNLGEDGAVLLYDDRATREGILDYFFRLTTVGQDDFVVIAFSGHGSMITISLPTMPIPMILRIPPSRLTKWWTCLGGFLPVMSCLSSTAALVAGQVQGYFTGRFLSAHH